MPKPEALTVGIKISPMPDGIGIDGLKRASEAFRDLADAYRQMSDASEAAANATTRLVALWTEVFGSDASTDQGSPEHV